MPLRQALTAGRSARAHGSRSNCLTAARICAFTVLRVNAFAGGLEHPAQLGLLVGDHKDGAVDEQVLGRLALLGFLCDGGQLEGVDRQLRDLLLRAGQEHPAIAGRPRTVRHRLSRPAGYRSRHRWSASRVWPGCPAAGRPGGPSSAGSSSGKVRAAREDDVGDPDLPAQVGQRNCAAVLVGEREVGDWAIHGQWLAEGVPRNLRPASTRSQCQGQDDERQPAPDRPPILRAWQLGLLIFTESRYAQACRVASAGGADAPGRSSFAGARCDYDGRRSRTSEAPGRYSKLVAAPRLEASHLSKAAWLSTTSMPDAMAEWELPQSWAQLIW